MPHAARPRRTEPVAADAITTITTITVEHLDDVMDLFAQAWWTRERPRARVAAMLDSSPANAGLLVEGELVAFARAISDFEFKAVIVDVIVDASLRRAGLGRRVVSTLLNHPALGRVDDFELYCDPELVGYYAQLGFAQPAGTQFMRLSRT